MGSQNLLKYQNDSSSAKKHWESSSNNFCLIKGALHSRDQVLNHWSHHDKNYAKANEILSHLLQIPNGELPKPTNLPNLLLNSQIKNLLGLSSGQN